MDLISLLASVGWWTGAWQSEIAGLRGDEPLFGGDILILKDDGTFTTKGALNILSGDIWINLNDGSINLDP